MKQILVLTPIAVTPSMVSIFVTEVGGKWNDTLNQGIVQNGEEVVWIEGDTSLDVWDNPEDREMLRQKYDIEPEALLCIEVGSNGVYCTEFAEKVASKMVEYFQGVRLEV